MARERQGAVELVGKPTLVLLAGPNGAGKTTFVNRFLRQRADVFRSVNPDAISLSQRERA